VCKPADTGFNTASDTRHMHDREVIGFTGLKEFAFDAPIDQICIHKSTAGRRDIYGVVVLD
jgi:hypothetical protein